MLWEARVEAVVAENRNRADGKNGWDFSPISSDTLKLIAKTWLLSGLPLWSLEKSAAMKSNSSLHKSDKCRDALAPRAAHLPSVAAESRAMSAGQGVNPTALREEQPMQSIEECTGDCDSSCSFEDILGADEGNIWGHRAYKTSDSGLSQWRL